eukprot:465884-Alexandrium_andersonii.AAC.1
MTRPLALPPTALEARPLALAFPPAGVRWRLRGTEGLPAFASPLPGVERVLEESESCVELVKCCCKPSPAPCSPPGPRRPR